nr:MAG TPA: hypothetical protein [Caudoviricetes sp.]
MKKGIDVSENNGAVDWGAVKEAGYDFAIVRASYGRTHTDDDFRRNVEGAHAAGLICGAYHYGYGLNVAQAREEAQNCRRVIDEAGVLLELPVFYDMEDADGYKARRDFAFDPHEMTEMCRAFRETIGLDCGIYASYSWLCDYIDWQSLDCAIWNAQWGSEDDLKGYMWQYTDSAQIGGKSFDANILYA